MEILVAFGKQKENSPVLIQYEVLESCEGRTQNQVNMVTPTLKYSRISIFHLSGLTEAIPYSSVRGLMEAPTSHSENL